MRRSSLRRVLSTGSAVALLAAAFAPGPVLSGCSSDPREIVASSSDALIVVAQSVLTQHNDNSRSGAYLTETTLTPSNVNAAQFGRLYTRAVDGQIASQPLYVHGAVIDGVSKNIVIVATRNNSVYAFDADDLGATSGPLWTWTGPPASEVDGFDMRSAFPGDATRGLCGQTHGPVGITGTPVIDPATGTMYVVTRTASEPTKANPAWNAQYVLSAVDITSGLPRWGSGVTIDPKNADWDPNKELNRPALLQVGNLLYIAFGDLVCDDGAGAPKSGTHAHGWLVAYDTSGNLQGSFETTPPINGNTMASGGIWQSGNGPAADASGNVYFQTGNNDACLYDFPLVANGNSSYVCQGYSTTDSLPATAPQYGESILKLRLGWGGFAAQQFRPGDWYRMDTGARSPTTGLNGLLSPRDWVNRPGDSDLGSGGFLLLPATAAHPSGTGIGGGKPGRLFHLDLGASWQPDSAYAGANPSLVQPGLQAFVNTMHPEIVADDYDQAEEFGPNIHGTPIFWATGTGGFIYAMPEKDYLRSFAWNGSTSLVTPAGIAADRSPDGMPGSVLSLSANGQTSGIVWASIPKFDATGEIAPGRFAAFDALTLAKLWEDDEDVAFAKFTAPTIADGKVFRPTFGNQLIVYGLTNAPPGPRCMSQADKFNAVGGAPAIGTLTTATSSAFQVYVTAGDAPTSHALVTGSDGCTHVVHEQLFTKYQSDATLLGTPTSDDERIVGAEITPQSRLQTYQNGAIYSTDLHIVPPTAASPHDNSVGAHEIDGAIAAAYQQAGGAAALGLPLTDVQTMPDGSLPVVYSARFERGSITTRQRDGVAPPVVRSTTAWLDVPETWFTGLNGVNLPQNDIMQANLSDWTQAARIAQRYCYNQGYVSGTFTGDSNLTTHTYGVVCYGDEIKVFESDYENMWLVTGVAATDQRLNPAFNQLLSADAAGSAAQPNWAYAGRVAQDFCGRQPGFVGGFFLGDELWGTNRQIVCFRAQNATQSVGASLTDAPISEIAADYWCSGTEECTTTMTAPCNCRDTALMPWDLASRVASHLCVKPTRGFVGGHFTGNQNLPGTGLPVVKQLLCYR